MSPQPKVSLREETMDWLKERYPDAMSDAERVRMAINEMRNASSERIRALKMLEEEREKGGSDDE